MNLVSWKTTVGGLLAAVGEYLKANFVGTWHSVGELFTGIGLLVIGVTARDNNVRSEDVGLK